LTDFDETDTHHTCINMGMFHSLQSILRYTLHQGLNTFYGVSW